MFLRISAILQVILFCLILTVYVLEPSLEWNAALALPANHKLLALLPSYWFWGMFQQLNGSAAGPPEILWLARRAWEALAAGVIAAAATIMPSYVGAMRRILEQPDILPAQSRRSWHLPGSAKSAVLMFALRTILRNRQHRMILSFYMGAGFGVMLILLRPSISDKNALAVTLLAASVLMLCTAAAAIRAVFSMPIALRANWIFRMAALRSPVTYMQATRRAFLLLAVTPVWCAFAVFSFCLLPWRPAAAHLVLLALLGMILSDVCASGFRKIPFTCSYQPGKANLQFAIWAALVLLPLSILGAAYEWLHLQTVSGQLIFAVALLVPALVLRWWTDRRMGTVDELQFEEAEEPPIVSLALSADAAMLSRAG
jgi:hypothetical protein